MKLNEEQKKIVEENHNLIYWYITTNKLELDEWYGLLAIELCKTVERYNPELGSLSNYFKMRADNLVRKEYSKTQLQKNKHDEISFDDYIKKDCFNDGIEEDTFIYDFIKEDKTGILSLRAEGYTQEEIANMLGVTQSYISKILERKKDEYFDRQRD